MGMFIHASAWEGDRSHWEEQLEEAGISKYDFDVNQLTGCSFDEIQSMVDKVIADNSKE
ncbi:MAG: hypothetical protein NC299_15675 [Lachnospiraceae bacterium]|nr:hypothetical protein [Ruminococcus sp.]MCM1276773.1 hypothetical protein [Lachnospiraceae bacterium]